MLLSLCLHNTNLWKSRIRWVGGRQSSSLGGEGGRRKLLLVGLNCSHMSFALWHQSPILSTLVLSLSLILSVKLVDRFHRGEKRYKCNMRIPDWLQCNSGNQCLFISHFRYFLFFISHFRYGAQSNRPKLLLQAGPGDHHHHLKTFPFHQRWKRYVTW